MYYRRNGKVAQDAIEHYTKINPCYTAQMWTTALMVVIVFLLILIAMLKRN